MKAPVRCNLEFAHYHRGIAAVVSDIMRFRTDRFSGNSCLGIQTRTVKEAHGLNKLYFTQAFIQIDPAVSQSQSIPSKDATAAGPSSLDPANTRTKKRRSATLRHARNDVLNKGLYQSDETRRKLKSGRYSPMRSE
ncbi:hypothetical protein HW561_00095 [Rhodobacteraceae bacterium B1Z28]|uniref:Uncharacterized protein n=1 Tax=Ruegeria haliotis TaxID=2747601 RepID=A0ABX2PJA7_9RHOB|nr:hypothetical protein [Ruegeria haliotis]NVO54191.1 hypothetical protein [Ruegeria haliotis]